MKTTGKPCRAAGENLEESASSLKNQAEIIEVMDWPEEARELRECADRIERIGRRIRTGEKNVDAVPAFLHRNS